MGAIIRTTCTMCQKPVQGRGSNRALYCFDCLALRCTPGFRARDPRRAARRYFQLAHEFVAAAVRFGDLIDLKTSEVACADCGCRACEYDHRDYMKPLQVDPVCRSCNAARGEGANKHRQLDQAKAA